MSSWRDLFVRRGALMEGHFLLSSGRHSSAYIQCAKVLERPQDAEVLGRALADAAAAREVDRVVSPPLGALLIGYEVARALGVPFAFPERSAGGDLVLRRGFVLQSGERVLLVEDVVTTGRTTVELLALLRSAGATPVGLLALVDRSEAEGINGFPVNALLREHWPTFLPRDCPLCAEGLPLSRPGSRNVSGERFV